MVTATAPSSAPTCPVTPLPTVDTVPGAIRVATFKGHERTLLIVVPKGSWPSGKPIHLPPLAAPFDPDEIRRAFAKTETPVRVSREHLGEPLALAVGKVQDRDWKDRAEKTREAQAIAIAERENSPLLAVLSCEELMVRKDEEEHHLRTLKARLREDREVAEDAGVSPYTDAFREREQDYLERQRNVLTIQHRLRVLRQADRDKRTQSLAAESAQRAAQRASDVREEEALARGEAPPAAADVPLVDHQAREQALRRFVHAAKDLLPRDIYLQIWAQVDAKKNAMTGDIREAITSVLEEEA